MYLFSETLPNWIMALSAASAAILFFWRKQDRLEARVERESNIKNSVNAVWVAVKTDESPQRKWGILVTNDLQTAIRDFEVQCTGNRNSSTLRHPNVQPGRHFFESVSNGSPKSWALPTSSFFSPEYITASEKYRTGQMSFSYADQTYSK